MRDRKADDDRLSVWRYISNDCTFRPTGSNTRTGQVQRAADGDQGEDGIVFYTDTHATEDANLFTDDDHLKSSRGIASLEHKVPHLDLFVLDLDPDETVPSIDEKDSNIDKEFTTESYADPEENADEPLDGPAVRVLH